MTFVTLPLAWALLAILVALVGAICVSFIGDPLRSWHWGLVFTGAVLAASVAACVVFYFGAAANQNFGAYSDWFAVGRQVFVVDELNAPLLPLVALLHFLTALATGRTKMRRFSIAWSLLSESWRLATFASANSWLLVGLLIASTVPPYLELVNRKKPTRVYLAHMLVFIVLLVLGLIGVGYNLNRGTVSAWGLLLLMTAVLIRCGSFPAHCWITDWMEHASFGNALLFVTPLTGVYAAIRLVLPVAPDWMLQGLGIVSLVTAVYASGMAVMQKDARRFFAYLFVSHASLVLLGLEMHNVTSLTGALALWVAAALSLMGLGLTLRALEARFGRLSLAYFHGIYEHSPALAICFILTGLASVGFPGTLGFVATELLVEGAIESSLLLGVFATVATALNGIAVVRAYFCLFTGARHVATVSLAITRRERFAVLTLAILILGGGIVPQPGIISRYEAAECVLRMRDPPVASGADQVAMPIANPDGPMMLSADKHEVGVNFRIITILHSARLTR